MAARRVFLSYRRGDSAATVGRIRDHLVDALGEDAVFKDVDSIAPGADFRLVLRSTIETCDAMLVAIGPDWLVRRDGADGPRLFEQDDFVRAEIEQAFGLGVTVIPVLVEGATMPSADALPESIRDITFRQAALVRGDPDFRTDIERLLAAEPFRLTPDARPAVGPVRRSPVGLGLAAVGAVVALAAATVVVVALTNDDAASPSTSVESRSSSSADDTTAVSGAVGERRPPSADDTLEPVPSASFTASASSELEPQGAFAYGAAHLVDDDLETAWTDGVEGLGIGESIDFTADEPVVFDVIQIWPGWQTAAPCRFEKNARPSVVDVVAVTEDGSEELTTAVSYDPSSPSAPLEAFVPTAAYVSARLVIAEVVEGRTCQNGPFEDTAISEVRFSRVSDGCVMSPEDEVEEDGGLPRTC